MESEIRALVDESEIRALVYRFARAVDRGDFELLRACFDPEASVLHGDFKGSGEEFVAFAETSLKALERSQHFVTNVQVEVDGDRARGESYCLALARRSAEGECQGRDDTIGQRYLDEYERRRGEWRITRRICIWETTRSNPVDEGGELPAVFPRGVRGRQDLSYGWPPRAEAEPA